MLDIPSKAPFVIDEPRQDRRPPGIKEHESQKKLGF
jgi:hypothetical protein